MRHKEMLSQHAPSLAAFDNQVNGKLTQPRRYEDRYLGTITVKLPHLSVLNIAGHTNISHEGYRLIAKHMANLEVLILPKQPYKAEWIGFLDLVESYLHKLISLLGIDHLELTGRIFKTVTYIQTSGNILMHDTESTDPRKGCNVGTGQRKITALVQGSWSKLLPQPRLSLL